MSISKKNTSGYRGVSWSKNLEKWWARISVNGKRIHLGYFDNIEDAVQSYKDAVEKYGLEKFLSPPISQQEYNKQYLEKNKDYVVERRRKYREKNRERLRQYSRDHYAKNKEIKNGYTKKYNQKVKKDVFDYYGNKCACCGESNSGFLTIDHINNDGYQHRKNCNIKGLGMYKYIKRNNFPDSFRILCWNCNCGRAYTTDKRCPHEIAKDEQC